MHPSTQSLIQSFPLTHSVPLTISIHRFTDSPPGYLPPPQIFFVWGPRAGFILLLLLLLPRLLLALLRTMISIASSTTLPLHHLFFSAPFLPGSPLPWARPLSPCAPFCALRLSSAFSLCRSSLLLKGRLNPWGFGSSHTTLSCYQSVVQQKPFSVLPSKRCQQVIMEKQYVPTW